MFINRFHRFTNLAAAGSRAATTGLVREGNPDALVEGGRQQGSFAVAGMAHSGNPPAIDIRILSQVIDTPMESPRPGRQRPAVGGSVPGRIAIREERIETLAHIGPVRIHVTTVKSRQGIAAPN